jgi:membrane protein DedA with SNARE-associated domain
MTLEQLLSEYGYIAIGIGSFLQSGMILLLGGYASHREYLQLPWVMLCAFVSTFLSDQLFFYIGATRGKRLIESRPSLKAKSEKVLRLLDRHQVLVLLGFRFVYGLRMAAPFLIGMQNINPLRLLILNSMGALLWTVVVGFLGYLFGQAIESTLGDIKHFELPAILIIAALAVMVRLVMFWRQH